MTAKELNTMVHEIREKYKVKRRIDVTNTLYYLSKRTTRNRQKCTGSRINGFML